MEKYAYRPHGQCSSLRIIWVLQSRRREKKSFGSLREVSGRTDKISILLTSIPVHAELSRSMPIFSHEGRENRRAESRWTSIKHQEVAPTGKDDVLRNGASLYSSEKGRRLVIRSFL